MTIPTDAATVPSPSVWAFLTRIWEGLTSPSMAVKEIGARRQARLLAALTLILALTTLLGGLASFTGSGGGSLVLFGTAVGMLIAYALSRTMYHTWGAALVSSLLIAGAFSNIWITESPNPSQTFYSFIPLMLILSATLLPLWGTAALATITLVGILLLPTVITRITFQDIFATWGVLLTISLLQLIAGRQRNIIERERLAELAARNRELQVLQTSLEQRVADRTRDLALAAEVGRGLSQVRNLDNLLIDAVELIRTRFDLYYTQIYLTEPDGRSLLMRAGTGQVGQELQRRGLRLPFGAGSLNGTAATERRAVIVSDTASDPNFRPNPLLPNTRSEMCIPLLSDDRVVGVLDLQSNQAGELSQELLPAFTALAGQLAIAIQNAFLLAETQQARAEVEKQMRRLVGQGWQEFLDAIHTQERFTQLYTAPELSEVEAAPEGVNTISLPIEVAGQAVGTLDLERAPDEVWTAADQDLVATVAKQVAQQIENLRLLAQGEQYRAEAEEAVRRLTREGWQTYTTNANTLSEGFAYDGEQIQPAHQIELPQEVAEQPLTLRGVPLGEILVDKTALNPETEQILATIAGQLTAHIENLRLSEQTQLALMENERQNVNLSALNRVVSAASGARDMTGLLDTAAHEILKVLKARNVGIAVFADTTRAQLRIMADANLNPDDPSAVGELIPVVGNTSTEYVLANRHSLVVEKAQTDPRTASIHALMQARNTHSLMIVPLLARGEIIGTIGVDSDDADRHFTPEEVTLVETMAGQLAGAIDNLRSFEGTQRRANREATVNAITQKIQETVSVESALQTAAAEIGRLLKLRRAIVEIGHSPTAAVPTNGSAN